MSTVDNPAWWWGDDALWQSLGYESAEEGQAALGITEPIMDPEDVKDDPLAGQDDEFEEAFTEMHVNDISYLCAVYRFNNSEHRLKRRGFNSLRNFFDSQLKWTEFTPVVDFRYAEVDYVYQVLPGDLLIRYEPFMPNIVGMVESIPEITITEETEYKEARIEVLFPQFPVVGEVVIPTAVTMNLEQLKSSKFSYVIRSTMSSAGNLFRLGYETGVRGMLPS